MNKPKVKDVVKLPEKKEHYTCVDNIEYNKAIAEIPQLPLDVVPVDEIKSIVEKARWMHGIDSFRSASIKGKFDLSERIAAQLCNSPDFWIVRRVK